MQKIKKPLIFTSALLPFIIGASIFTTLYQFSMYPQEIIDETVAQVGSYNLLVSITVVQSIMYAVVSAFLGYIISDYTGLMKPFKLNRKSLIATLSFSAVLGTILVLDHYTFGNIIPDIQQANLQAMNLSSFIASVLYGGIVEELMMRLLFMSLVALVIWKLFFRKCKKENIPQIVFVIANITAAFLFAVGHLPATAMLFGEITPIVLLRCILLNGSAGFMFGEFYRRYGISYAILSHMTAHIVKYLLFIILL